ncbi:hypothetical protein ASC75_17190 [Aminobacter sp. DSM 101952]|uniref:HD domain-containing protein n=1 Tax=Aminobacter sp. DSM 101952 TaxID=2735891 RepID=UPI0006FA995A|nr:hypothetical protein [Aminobacter sp. DSM 101952]KQU75765.1 hypothetical protein ASC75_17190 [Aminobacter sp. DSM 101952]
MSLIDEGTKAELIRLYEAKDRHYHGIRHIEALLALLEAHRAAFADPDAVEAAIWFHDAIYDSRRKDNEALSAALAAGKLKEQVDAPRLARIVTMIEATATHEVPTFEDTSARNDAALLLDMDLSILGAPPATFDAYEANVRREYAWVSEADWRAGRAAVLRNFLARPRIFHTDIFVARFEAQARENMERSLEALSA